MYTQSKRLKLFSFVALIIVLFFISTFLFSLKKDYPNTSVSFEKTSSALAKDKEKDKTPPMISDVHTDLVTETSAVILWTTDEPSDSSIKYGIDPKTNKKGPEDSLLVISHSIALSELIPQQTYAFCVESKDESKNKSEECGTFFTAEQIPIPKGGGGKSITIQNKFSVSGFTAPKSVVTISLHSLPFGRIDKQEVVAGDDGSFAGSFEGFSRGFYFFSIITKDINNVESVRKGFYFNIGGDSSDIIKENIILPPTLSVLREVITWGDVISASGMTIPNTTVLIQIGDISYETKSDDNGEYNILINTARLTPGKIHLRARNMALSEFNPDYSQSIIVTVSTTMIPKADIDKDGLITIKDFSIFRAHPIDMNNDNILNAIDTSIFLRAFSRLSKTK